MRARRVARGFGALLLAGLPASAGCAKQGPAEATGRPEDPPGTTATGPTLDGRDRATGAWRREDIDLNGDGRADVINWFGGGESLARRDSDLNLDGVVDVTTWYQGDRIEREEMDGDFDGKIDWIDTYQAGERVKAEADTDYDGHVDVVITYEDGVAIKKVRWERE